MKNMTTQQRLQESTNKSMELMREAIKLRKGTGDFDIVAALIKEVYRDQLTLIELIDEIELDKMFNE